MPLLALTGQIVNTLYSFMGRTLTTTPDDTSVRMSIGVPGSKEESDRFRVAVVSEPGKSLARIHYRNQHVGISGRRQQHLRMRVRFPL